MFSGTWFWPFLFQWKGKNCFFIIYVFILLMKDTPLQKVVYLMRFSQMRNPFLEKGFRCSIIMYNLFQKPWYLDGWLTFFGTHMHTLICYDRIRDNNICYMSRILSRHGTKICCIHKVIKMINGPNERIKTFCRY